MSYKLLEHKRKFWFNRNMQHAISLLEGVLKVAKLLQKFQIPAH